MNQSKRIATPTMQYRYWETAVSPKKTAESASQPVKRPAVPQVKNPAWVRTPIDAFVLAKLDEKNLSPVRAADRAAAEVHEVPLVGDAVFGRVLAHRRDEDAIGDRDRPQREGAEKEGHGSRAGCALREPQSSTTARRPAGPLG